MFNRNLLANNNQNLNNNVITDNRKGPRVYTRVIKLNETNWQLCRWELKILEAP